MEVRQHTRIFPPKGAPKGWANIFTNEILETGSGSHLLVGDIFRTFPLGLLVRTSGQWRTSMAVETFPPHRQFSTSMCKTDAQELQAASRSGGEPFHKVPAGDSL
jgi:hypothetical protein